MQENEVYTIHEVATLLKVSVYTVTRRLKSGEIPGRKIGKTWRVMGSDLIKYMRGDIEQPVVENDDSN